MITLAIGQQGSGKTWALAHRVRARLCELASDGEWLPVLIHDERMREGQGYRDDCLGCLAPREHRFETVAAYLESFDSGQAPYVASIYGDDPERLFEVAWNRRSAGGMVLVIDELDRLPERFQGDSPIYRCLHHGRPYPIDIYGGCRRPENVNKAWISEAAEMLLFRIGEKNSLASIRGSGVMGVDEVVVRLPNLKPRQFLTLTGAAGR